MKISCPNCGKTYQIPQELIDAVLEKHREKPIEIADSMFLPVDRMPIARRPASRFTLPQAIKIAMLVVTLLWPVGTLLLAALAYETTINSPTLIDMGNINGEHLFGDLRDGPNVRGRSKERIAVDAFFGSLCGVTVCYGMTIAFLGVAWFATGR
jgi:hypothetical protein